MGQQLQEKVSQPLSLVLNSPALSLVFGWLRLAPPSPPSSHPTTGRHTTGYHSEDTGTDQTSGNQVEKEVEDTRGTADKTGASTTAVEDGLKVKGHESTDPLKSDEGISTQTD